MSGRIQEDNGGRDGIRTHGRVAPALDFEEGIIGLARE